MGQSTVRSLAVIASAAKRSGRTALSSHGGRSISTLDRRVAALLAMTLLPGSMLLQGIARGE